MIVVADTSPLNYLIRLGYPDILQKMYGRVLAPRAVLMEMQHPEAPPEVRVWASSPPDWLEVRQVQRMDGSLPAELGQGECEAIALALEVHASVLLMDDRAGRDEAEIRHLEVTGTLTVLLLASFEGLLDFPVELKRLRGYGFRVSRALEAAMLARYEQAKPRER